MTPFEASRSREARLIDGLNKLATQCGIQLRDGMYIDSLGEISIIAEREGEVTPKYSRDCPCGNYGEKFAAALSPHSPRCGIYPMSSIDGINGWCKMNHFKVEAMLRQNNIIE